MSRAKLAVAGELYREGNYQLAHDVLLSISDPAMRDQVEAARKKVDEKLPPVPSSRGNSRQSPVGAILTILLIVTAAGVCYFLGRLTAPSNVDVVGATATAVAMETTRQVVAMMATDIQDRQTTVIAIEANNATIAARITATELARRTAPTSTNTPTSPTLAPSDVPPTDDPNAPALPDAWKQLPGMSLKTAQDLLKKPYGLSAGAFLNAAGASPQGGAKLMSTLKPEVLLYIQAHDPKFFDTLEGATISLFSKETLQKLPQSVQDRITCLPDMECPVVRVSSPQPNTEVHGSLQIIGAVSLPNFNRYQIEVGVGQQPTTFNVVDGPYISQPGRNDTFLGRWDTEGVPDGQYMIKLWAVDEQGNFLQALVPIIVRNTGVVPTTPTQVRLLTSTFTPLPTWTLFVQSTWTPFIFPTATPYLPPTETPIVIIPVTSTETPQQ